MARNSYIQTISAIQCVTLDEAKIHLRVSQSDDDNYITSLIIAAQQNVENYCNIMFFRTTVVQRGDSWGDISSLLISPIKSSADIALVSIKYYDADNVQITANLADFIFDKYSQPARIGMAPDFSLPSLAGRIDAVEATYSVGTTLASKVPLALKQAVPIFIGQWYENRQEAVVGRSVGVVPMAAQYLMNPYRIQTLGIDVC